MGGKRQEIVGKLWGGSDPFAERSAFRGRVDMQGWASNNPILSQTIREVRPSLVVEIGVWKGGSVITMAEEMQRLAMDSAVIAVDTWLGAADHWIQPMWFKDLRMEAGYPSLFKTFMANILEKGLEDIVVPLPIDSMNAASLLKHYNIVPDVVHVDGGHDFASVSADLQTWWPQIRSGGALIGDDYHPIGVEVWPEVRAAFHEYFKTTELENTGGKCLIRKP